MQSYNIKRKIIFFTMFFAGIFLLPKISLAATINAASCNRTDVQTAINSANDGDTVSVPIGTCTWTASVIIYRKAIVLQGAGIDQTVITDGTGPAYGEEPLWITGIEGKSFRVTGFTFREMQKRNSTEPAISIQGNSKNWRVDHSKFTTALQGRGIIANGYGLIDNNIFVNTTQGIAVFGTGATSWGEPLALGTADAVYVESNTFDYISPLDGALDAYNGARYVFRYNTVINTNIGHHGLDSGGYRSTHSYERYNNTFSAPSATPWTVFGSRGGTGVDFNNIITGGYGLFSIVVNYRSCGSYAPWGMCNGSNPIDGNQEPNGYPCMDQAGRTNEQVLSPVYEWNNTINGLDGDITVHDPWGCSALSDHLKENRDYYNDIQKPGYTPYVYPHPLRAEAAPPQDTTPPASPTGVQVQ